jgi:hypothetical protein
MSRRLGIGAEVQPSSTRLVSLAFSVAILAGATVLAGAASGATDRSPSCEPPRLR